MISGQKRDNWLTYEHGYGCRKAWEMYAGNDLIEDVTVRGMKIQQQICENYKLGCFLTNQENNFSNWMDKAIRSEQMTKFLNDTHNFTDAK